VHLVVFGLCIYASVVVVVSTWIHAENLAHSPCGTL
jgi:hypothetical protein